MTATMALNTGHRGGFNAPICSLRTSEHLDSEPMKCRHLDKSTSTSKNHKSSSCTCSKTAQQSDKIFRPDGDGHKQVGFSKKFGSSRKKTAPIPLNVITVARRGSDIMAEAVGGPKTESSDDRAKLARQPVGMLLEEFSPKPITSNDVRRNQSAEVQRKKKEKKPPTPTRQPPGDLLEDFSRPIQAINFRKSTESTEGLGKYLRRSDNQYESKMYIPKPSKKKSISTRPNSFDRSQNSLDFEEQMDWKNSSVDWGEDDEEDQSTFQNEYEEALRRENNGSRRQSNRSYTTTGGQSARSNFSGSDMPSMSATLSVASLTSLMTSSHISTDSVARQSSIRDLFRSRKLEP